MCAVSMLVGAPRNCSRFVWRYGFHEDVLDSVHVPILLYCCTRIQYFGLAIILSDSGERMHLDKIPPQRMHAACRIVTRGSCCAKRFAEFNGNCESYCCLEQLVVSLSAANEGKSAAGTYHPKTEGYYRQRHLLRTAYFARGWRLIDRPKPSTCSYLPCSYLTIRLPPRCSGCLFLFQYSMSTCPIMLCSTVCCAVQQ